jgi:hypothetical protein
MWDLEGVRIVLGPNWILKIKYIPSPDFKMGECDSHSYHALFNTATRQTAVSRTAIDNVVLVRMAPRKEFLFHNIQY